MYSESIQTRKYAQRLPTIGCSLPSAHRGRNELSERTQPSEFSFIVWSGAGRAYRSMVEPLEHALMIVV